MKWDVFRPRKRGTADPVEEAIEKQRKTIEKFAPRNYAGERERSYYNYRMLPLYREKLLTFLQIVSKKERLKEDPATLAQDLFVSLRNFYDPRIKASSEAVAKDPAFKRKFKEIYRYFYDRESPGFQEIADWFRAENP
jgi:hypothetical protein